MNLSRATTFLLSFLSGASLPGVVRAQQCSAQDTLTYNTGIALKLKKVAQVPVKDGNAYPFSYNMDVMDNVKGDTIYILDQKEGRVYSYNKEEDSAVPVKVFDKDEDDIPAGLDLDLSDYKGSNGRYSVKALTQGPGTDLVVVFTSRSLPEGWQKADATLPAPGSLNRYACQQGRNDDEGDLILMEFIKDLYRPGTTPACADMSGGGPAFVGYDTFVRVTVKDDKFTNFRPFFVSESSVQPGHLGGGIITLPDGMVLYATGDCLPYGTEGGYAPQLDFESCGKILRVDPLKKGEWSVAAKGVRNSQKMRLFGDSEKRRRRLEEAEQGPPRAAVNEGHEGRDLADLEFEWHPQYSEAWDVGFCKWTKDANSPGFSTNVGCCKTAYAGQVSGFCLSKLESPPTMSPTPLGGPDEYYPDYTTNWVDGKCINTVPKPEWRQTYPSKESCCKAAYAGQVSNACMDDASNMAAVKAAAAAEAAASKYLAFMDIGGVTSEEVNAIPVSDLDPNKDAPNFGWGINLKDGKAREGTYYVSQGVPFVLSTQPPCASDAPPAEEGYVQPWAQFGRDRNDSGQYYHGICSFGLPKVNATLELLITEFNTGMVLGSNGAYETADGPQSLQKLKVIDDNDVEYDSINQLAMAENNWSYGGFEWGRCDPRLFHFSDGTLGVILERTGVLYSVEEVQID